MADYKFSSQSSFVAFKVLSKDKSKTWDGNSFENHSAVSNYATDGNQTFSADPSPAGGNDTEYTVTLDILTITGAADTVWLAPFTATPAYTGGYIIGAVPEENWKRLTVNDDQELVDDESLEEGGVGGLTEEEVQALIAAAISGAQVEGGGGLNPVQSDLTLVLRKGTQYAAANNRAAQWTIADWGGPSLSGLSVTLLFAKTSDVDAGDSTADLAINGTASNVDGDAVLSVDITATNLDELESVSASTPWFNYRYQLRLNLSGGAYHELASNAATISPKFTAPA